MHEIPLTENERESPNEYTEVERPLLVQLEAMGWQRLRGDLDYPQKTFRERFRDVILMDKLRDAVRRINRDDDGNPYRDDVTIDWACDGGTQLFALSVVSASFRLAGTQVGRIKTARFSVQA